ncbi:MAG TPA: hypothetical protein VHV83_08225 [Armatimonadota bacterium]|nr:hypothetical protein [Armatimonadota bacterium]
MHHIICVCSGMKYGNNYVEKLHRMVTRYLDTPFTFTCVTDHPYEITPGIETIDSSSWGTTGWFTKLRLFDADATPYDSMLYLDVSLVIKKPLRPLIEFATAQHKDFVGLRDWHYDCINSCIMWIKKSPTTQTVWDTYASGKTYNTILHGDQDYIDAVIRDKHLEEHVAYFPQQFIASYKKLLRTHRYTPDEEERMLHEAIIVKFHGHPKPHELLNTWLRFRHLTLRYPRYAFHDWTFLTKETQEWWK